ncbi:hypothetical protein KDA00_05670 [Candidatus Saccharibacteria bacterium]|nr:hypothetical protein [Candidatus Saccharibacteria bacterium]
MGVQNPELKIRDLEKKKIISGADLYVMGAVNLILHMKFHQKNISDTSN